MVLNAFLMIFSRNSFVVEYKIEEREDFNPLISSSATYLIFKIHLYVGSEYLNKKKRRHQKQFLEKTFDRILSIYLQLQCLKDERLS